MKLVETFEVKQFKVDLYLAYDKYLRDDRTKFHKYFLMVESRYLQVSYGKLKYYLNNCHNNEEDIDMIGFSLLTIDKETGGEVKIKQTQNGFKIDCLELTTQETQELYLQINKFIRNYERQINEEK